MDDTPTYTIGFVLVAFVAASLFILIGSVIRHLIPVISKLHIPAAVIGGIIALLLGPQVAGPTIAQSLSLETEMKEMFKLWKQMPAYLISVVFAALMMGRALPSLGKIWTNASPHLVVGYISAWGQYIVGILLALLVLVPFYDANPLSSMLVAIGFQGGYGTAAGLSDTYGPLGFGEGYDLALGMATAGKVSAILVGLLLINIAVRQDQMKSPEEKREEHLNEDISEKKAKKHYQRKREEQHFSADTLVIHFALLSVAIAVGGLMKFGLISIEGLTLEAGEKGFVQFIPLFPLALIGGGLVQMAISRLHLPHIVNAQYLHSISHSFLDLLIVVAIATLSLSTIAENWQLLLILISSAIAWNLFVFFFIAPYFYQDEPWARGVGDFAHATGATTTGLLMMKVVDPTDDAGARSSFNMKQTFYEPIVGGGFITALSLPAVHAIGLVPSLIVFTLLLVLTLLFGWKVVGLNSNGGLFGKDDGK